mmetsp:Transcript_421/g.1366  ORF Transcript_421/g.1366 Transcript_421/m.1366 type:complete len:134 (-) Transcript_421:620-1021(-)
MSLKFITDVKDDESWESVVIQAPSSTLCVIDVYTQWCGPCTALDHKLQQLHIELVNSEIKYVRAISDYVTALENHRDRSMPLFQFYRGGVQVDELHGANQVELTRRVQSLSHASREHNSESAGNVDAAIIQEC